MVASSVMDFSHGKCRAARGRRGRFKGTTGFPEFDRLCLISMILCRGTTKIIFRSDTRLIRLLKG